MVYEAFNLPENMVSVSYGLLITVVTLDMDGKTFQCMVPTGVEFEYHKSSVGTLTVEKSQTEPGSGYGIIVGSPVTTTTEFSIDHQRTVFGRDLKNISLKSAEVYNMYQLRSKFCNGTDIPGRNWYTRTSSFQVSTDFTVYKNKSAYFQLCALANTLSGRCQNSVPDFIIQKNDITAELKVPFADVCVNVESSVGPYIVLPSKQSGSEDCPCAILVKKDNTYLLDDCSCGRHTIFRESFFAFKLRVESESVYHICLRNLTEEMNNTRIHFYELYRVCADDITGPMAHPYRNYFQSLQLVIVLPDPPAVTVNGSTGQINFVSVDRDGIELEFYQIIIADVTKQTILNVTSNSNTISVGDLFHSSICSPYNVTVEAHNAFGATNSMATVEASSDHNGDVCNCIKQNVNADLDLVTDDDYDTSQVLSVQVNCSHNYSNQSIDGVTLKLYVIKDHNDVSSPIILSCAEEAKYPFDFLKCDNTYDLKLSWVSTFDEGGASDSECLLYQVQDRNIACPKKSSSNSFSITNIIIICAIIGSLLVLTIIVLSVALICMCHKNKTDGHHSQLN